MKLKDISVELFKTLATSEEILDLLEIPITSVKGKKRIRKMQNIREQIQETRQPYMVVDSDKSVICIYPTTSMKPFNGVVEKCFIQIDIYVHKKNELKDRRTLQIADKLMEILNGKVIFDYKLKYYNKIPSYFNDNREFNRYGLIFYYDNIIF